MPKKCVCGHDATAHQHYRGGSDCCLCVDQGCPSYRADTVIVNLLGGRNRPASTSRRPELVVVSRGAA